ncbi:hypothetical protein Fmac_001798 [Flemingia macrophylla]|uniref:Uncharacterized protein n=1 Tax=Flemingia macrophylla TaxID=520843 RepID=A0ABD1NIX3_9FABA
MDLREWKRKDLKGKRVESEVVWINALFGFEEGFERIEKERFEGKESGNPTHKTQRRNRWSSLSMLMKHEPLPLSFSSLTTFPSHPDNLLFFAATPSAALLHLYSYLCDAIRKESVEIADQFAVDSWIPHCAVERHVPKQRIAEAFSVRRELKLPVSRYVVDITLVQFSLVRELFSFALKNNHVRSSITLSSCFFVFFVEKDCCFLISWWFLCPCDLKDREENIFSVPTAATGMQLIPRQYITEGNTNERQPQHPAESSGSNVVPQHLDNATTKTFHRIWMPEVEYDDGYELALPYQLSLFLQTKDWKTVLLVGPLAVENVKIVRSRGNIHFGRLRLHLIGV